MVADKSAAKKSKEKKQGVPKALIYEVIDGKPIYYKGYKNVLNNTINLESVMAISSLQGFIISHLLEILFVKLGTKKYHIFTNEIGVHINHKNNLASDVGIYDKKVLTPDKITPHLLNLPAKLFIEVDIKAELEDMTETGYIRIKTQKLLDFGAEKVIWILSKPKQAIIATPGGKWQLLDWNHDVEMLEGHSFNIGKYLRSEGIEA